MIEGYTIHDSHPHPVETMTIGDIIAASSNVGSSMLADRVLDKKEKGAVDRYLTLLKAGGSDDPHELLKRAGVDMTTAAPYDAVAARMNRIMDEMEAILAKQKKR